MVHATLLIAWTSSGCQNVRPSLDEALSELSGTDLGLWVLGFALLGLFLLPILVSSAGILLMRYRLSEEGPDVQAVQPDGTNPDYTARFEELEQLGFRPVGTVYEELWLYGHEYYKCFPVRLLVSADGLTYAALYDLGWGGVVRVALDSVTDRGRLIQTAMPGAQIRSHDAEFHRTEVELGPVGDLLHKHRRETEKCLLKTDGRLARVSPAERTALDERIGRRLMSGIGQGGTGLTLVVLGWGLPFGIAVVTLITGFDQLWPRAVGIAGLVAAAAYLLFVFKLLPAFHRFLERMETDPP